VVEYVTIPRGVHDGVILRVKGKGNETFDGDTGDILIKVLVPASPYFERDGENLVLKKKVTACQAILGEKIMVRTLNGFKEVILPPGTNSSDKIVLKGHGVPNL